MKVKSIKYKPGNKIDKEIILQYQHPYRVLRQGGVLLILVIVALILGPLAPAMAAEEKAEEESGWEFQAGPYMWFLSMDGSVTVKGQKSDADLSFSDIWDELNIAGMVEFEGRKDRWGFFGDIIYANLGKDTHADGIRIDPNVNALWATAGGFYRLGTWDLANRVKNKPPAVTVDILAGARYTYLDVSLRIEDFPNQKKDKQWVDPIIGARTLFDLSERWTISLQGNIGGFGVGSDFTWGAFGLLGYRFPLFSKENNARVVAGYRAFSQDYTDGKGDNKFQWDEIMYGPVVGLIVQF
jgi:hypothetical protein